MSFQEFIVRVPATTANLGPAFDCVGMALGLWNDVVIKSSDSFGLTVEGSGMEGLPPGSKLFVIGKVVMRSW